MEFFREPRPDEQSFAAITALGERVDRLRSVLVKLAGGTPIRAYDLSYTTSPLTDRSLLSTVRQYGRDVAIDAAGEISGGTALPPQSFSYQDDALGQTFQAETTPPNSPPDTTELVLWFNTTNAAATGYKLEKVGGAEWTGGGNSTRAIASGDGYVEWTASPATTNNNAVIGLSNGDSGAQLSDIDFGIYQYYTGGYLLVAENGVWTSYTSQSLSPGDVLRVEVQGGVVHYKKNGVTFHTTSSKPINYPLRVDASIRFDAGVIENATITGTLEQIGPACGKNKQLMGDFDGDGRTDRLCTFGTKVEVSLGNGPGFDDPQVWSTTLLPGASNFTTVILADFNGDGLTDIADRVEWTGDFLVALSTGSSFTDWADWGNASGVSGSAYACRIFPAFTGAGDFNGDGLQDVYCQLANGYNQVFIGRSTGSSFQFSIDGELGCNEYNTRVGAIDFDGNGMDDWYCTGSNGGLLAFPGNGSTFPWPAFGTLSSFCSAQGFTFGDFNADGRTDVACLTNGKVALSTGRSFLAQGEYGALCAGSDEGFAADLDGDGASELVCNNSESPANDIEVRKWVNGSLAPAETWTGNWCTGKVSGGDFDGDGKPDLYCDSAAAAVGLNGTSGVMADLMSTIENGIGGTTTVEYTPSTAFDNTNNIPVKQTITAVTVEDGRGGSATTTYEYADGYFDRKERRFMGFGYAKHTLPCLAGEASCPYVETWLKQGLASAGKPERVVRSDGAGRALTILDYGYASNSPTFPLWNVLTDLWTTTLDGTGATCPSWPCASGRRTHTSFQYDAYGNITESLSYGDLDETGDEVLTTSTYQPNTIEYIVSAPASTETRDGTGTELLARSEGWYDGAMSASQPPTQGRLTTARRYLKEEGRYVESTFAYDAWGNVTSRTDETVRTSTTDYDTTCNIFPVSATNGAGEMTSSTWDPICSTPATATDLNGQVTTFLTDELCRSTEVQSPGGAFERRFYLDLGSPGLQRVRVETPAPTSGPAADLYEESYFDGLGRPYRTRSSGPTTGQGIIVDTAYNARGAVASVTAPYFEGDSPEVSEYVYDGFDRLVSLLQPDATTVDTSYGLLRTTVTDERGKSATTEFDVAGRWTAQERTLQGQPVRTLAEYDLLGRRVGLTDDAGNSWAWTFDSLGRLVESDDPSAGVWLYDYDDAGRQTAVVDAKGQQTDFAYDLAGRRTTKTVVGSPSVVSTTTYGEIRPGYYNAGRPTSIVSPGSVLELDYDKAGRAVRRTRTIDGVAYTLLDTYDAAGFLLRTTYPDGDAFASVYNPFVYDGAGRLSAVPGVSSQITYDAAGRPTTVTNANGTSSQRVYSADRGFLQSIVTTGPTGVIQDLSYGRDDSGLVLSVSSSPFAGESWTYAYDDLDRLVTANNVSNPAETQTFQYDSIGRITYNSAVGTYAYPTPGSPHPHAPSSIAGVGYTYDTNGNLQAGAGRTFTWDAENRLATVDTGGSTTTFTYGASGERLKMASGSSTSLYPFGDDFEIMDGVVVKYLALPGLGVVAKRVASDTFWIHADPLGSINAITNDAGGTVLRRAYRPYGEQQSQVGAHQDTRGYIGQRTDASTGLTYLHARYYDPQVGVFLKPDPIGAVGGLALYSYSGGNPVNFRDVSGLCHPQLCLTFTAPGSGGFHDSAWVYANGGGGGGGTCDLCWVPELVRLLGGWLGFGGGGRSLTPEQQLAGYEATQAFEAQHPGTTTFSHGGPSGHTNAAGAAAAAAAQQTAASTQAAHSPPSAVQSPTSPPSAPRGPSGPSGPSGPVPVPLPTPVPGAGGEGAPADRVGGTSGAEWTAHYAEATVREVFVNQWRRDGGCGRLWLESTAGVVRMAVGLGAGAGVLGGSTARNAASEHVVSRGLRYPLRSSIVRRFNLIARYSPHVGALAGLNVSVFMGIAEQRQAGAFHGGLCR